MATEASKALAPIDQFKNQLNDQAAQRGLLAQLPSDVPQEKFTAVVIRAVQENPALLNADRRSLFLSCQRAAQDGLMPDKREGVLLVYKTKVNEQWIEAVQWQPMIGGLRKRLAQAGFDIRAEVVHENDYFYQELGDTPEIKHRPAQLGQDRGAVIGAYAIATDNSTGKQYHEVMGLDDLEKVQAASKSPNSPAYATWGDQMKRKAVAKRLINWLPIDRDERLKGMIDRDNEQFDLDAAPAVSEAAREVQAVTRAALPHKKPDLPPLRSAPVFEHDSPPEPVKVEKPATTKKAVATPSEPPPSDPDDPGF